MKIWAIGCVRNEADVVAASVRHHIAQGFDRVVLIDNGSADGTQDVLEDLSRDWPLEWRSATGVFRQDEMLTTLASEARIRGAEWVCAVDADEFWTGSQ